MRYRKLSLVLWLCSVTSALAGCDPGDDVSPDAVDDTDISVRAFPTGSYWDEVRCDVDSPTLCYGHRAGTGAVWSQVYSDCYLSELVTLGWLVPSQNGWGANSCDPYGVPTSTPEYACYTLGGTPICFGGDDGWWSTVTPACQVDGYTSTYFATGSCITTIYASGYDSKKGKSGQPNKARGWIDDDAFDLRPACFLEQYGMVGMEADLCSSAWSMLECWDTINGPICLGFRDGETVQVVAPSLMADAIDQGAWIVDDPPSCSVDAIWEDVTCVYPAGQPELRKCLGLMDNVRVWSADPCAGPWAGYVEFHDLWAIPDDPVNYYGYDQIAWEG